MEIKIKNDEIFLTTTDTIIGIGGKVNDLTKEKIFQLKKRDSNKKLIIVVSSIEQLEKFEKLTKDHHQYIKKYWPGPYTLIINDNAYRMPANQKLLQLIESQGPFYLTSANISEEKPSLNLEHASIIFPNLKCFDFGPGSNKPSTIINTKNGKIIR